MRPGHRQLTVEADRAARNDGRANHPHLQLIPREEVVLRQPVELYRPPAFLRKTATAGLFEELAALLRRLWEINEEHVGENTLEVQVYYCLTGLHLDLAEAFCRWGEAYFRERADPRHLTPQVANDPVVLFERRLREVDEVLGRMSCLPHTLNSTFMNPAMEFVPWQVYRWLLSDIVRVEVEGNRANVFTAAGYRTADADLLERVAGHAAVRGWVDGHLERFLGRVADAVEERRLAASARRADADLRESLARMAADIQEMRPLLVRGFKPRKTAVSLGPGLAVAWAWCCNAGIANLAVGNDVQEVVERAEGNWTRLHVAVGHDGLLFDSRTPWLKADGLPSDGGRRPLVLNHHVVNLFHERLLSFYDRIDLGRVRAEGLAAVEAERPDEEAVVAALAVSCHDLGGRDEAAEDAAGHGRVRGLRSNRLLTLLADGFDCEVRQGKGSEVTVYRKGGRKFTLGHHGRCIEVHPVLLRRLLGRLGIATADWLRAACG